MPLRTMPTFRELAAPGRKSPFRKRQLSCRVRERSRSGKSQIRADNGNIDVCPEIARTIATAGRGHRLIPVVVFFFLLA